MHSFWKKHFLIVIFTAVNILLSTDSFAERAWPSFESSEHISLGNDIKLHLHSDDPGQVNAPITLPNGLMVSYGDIVSMGDFYEIPNQSIAAGKSAEERKARFMEAFNSFARNPFVHAEANQILAIIHHEEAMLRAGMEQGEDPETIFEQIGSNTNRQLNCVTGGGCDPSTWFLNPGRYLALANTDFDHFGNDALITFQTGQSLALEEAMQARITGDNQRLSLAYAINAFACHFLSDRFASGHMRTPRHALYSNVTPHVVGTLIAGFMHREENKYGLHVHNHRGDKWVAFGDRRYFLKQNDRNRLMLQEAMQKSADQVFNVYMYGTFPDPQEILNLIPYPDEVDNHANSDIATLFYNDAHTSKLMRRVNTDDINDHHWTADWWGWATLVQLSKERGLPTEAQAMLARSKLRKAALRDGLIMDEKILAALRFKNNMTATW